MGLRAILIGLTWLGTTGLGLSLLWSYSTEPGEPADPPVEWPADSLVDMEPGRPTLVMLAHPHCPCTRASLRELGRLMAQCKDELAAFVLFYKPEEFGPQWARTDLWDQASSIPGVQVRADPDGREARRFGSKISGQVVVYDGTGALAFSGGITASRGHSGDNFGRTAIVDLVHNGPTTRMESPVYGCTIGGDSCTTPQGPGVEELP